MKKNDEINKKIKLLFVAFCRIAKKILKGFCIIIYKIMKWSFYRIMQVKRALHIIYIHTTDFIGEWLYHYGSQLLINDIPMDNNCTNGEKKRLRVESYNNENDHSLVWNYTEAEDILSFISGWLETQIHTNWIRIQDSVSQIFANITAAAEYQLFNYRKIKIQQSGSTARVYTNNQEPASANAISFTEAIRLKIFDQLHAISSMFAHLIVHPILNKLRFLNNFEAAQAPSPNHITYYFQRE